MTRQSDLSARSVVLLHVFAAVSFLTCLSTALEGATQTVANADQSCCDWPVHFSAYPVEGSTLPELRRSLDNIAASGSHGGHHYGYTRWSFRLPSTKASTCNPATLNITAEIEVVLPVAARLELLSPSDREKWLRYVENLKAHEIEHVRIIDDGLAAMHAEVGVLPSCDRAVTIAREHERRILHRNEQLDATTDHGRNGDVVFPG